MIVLELNRRDLNRIDIVDSLVSKYYKSSLYQFCKKYNFDPLFVEIIKSVTSDYGYSRCERKEIEIPDELEERYYEVERKFTYGDDVRDVGSRIVALGVNWVVEDVIVHKSSSVFILTGCDSSRDLLANPVTNMPDIRYVGEGESFYVEVCSDFTTFMSKNNRYDIRKLKYMKLQDITLISKIKVVLLFIDVKNKTFYRWMFRDLPERQVNKYKYNSVSIEFDDVAEFQTLDILFKKCKEKQLNPSLYSTFNEEVEGKMVRDDTYILENGYWESLFRMEPAFIRCRQVFEDELNGTNCRQEDDRGLENIQDEGYWVSLSKNEPHPRYRSKNNGEPLTEEEIIEAISEGETPIREITDVRVINEIEEYQSYGLERKAYQNEIDQREKVEFDEKYYDDPYSDALPF